MAMMISIDINLGLPDQQSPYLLRYGRYHIYTPHKTYKIVPCNSNVVDFVIFKLQHLSVFIKDDIYVRT